VAHVSTPSSPEYLESSVELTAFAAQVLFHDLTVAAATANREVKQFRQLVESEGSRKIFEHVKESRARNPKGITPWRITDDSTWLSKEP